jgi:molecular chaperone DnaK
VSIEVTFEIDTDGIVNVSAKDQETGAQAGCHINLSSGLSDHEVAQAAARNDGMMLAER